RFAAILTLPQHARHVGSALRCADGARSPGRHAVGGRAIAVAQRASTIRRRRAIPCSDEKGADVTASSSKQAILREPAEHEFASELAALAQADKRQKPPNWRLSPWAVVTYLMGGKLDSGATITPKYVGQKRLMEIAVATLATDRALLLLGLPGTA